MSKKAKGNILLLITALIWGSAFVAQSVGIDAIGPYAYNLYRNIIAFVVMIPVCLFFRKRENKQNPRTEAEWTAINIRSVKAGILVGIVLFVASTLQQLGMVTTSAGKAGFITALYIVMVPILGLFIKKKTAGSVWVAVIVALVGFYLISVTEGFVVAKGDAICFLGAVCFAVHILVIDHASEKEIDGVLMSCVQFLVAAILSIAPSLLWDTISWHSVVITIVPILYSGVLSSGVGYTLQIIAQKDTDPTVASLLLSLESVFAAIFGFLLLHEILSTRELIGCALVFFAVIIVQIPMPEKEKKGQAPM